MAGELFARGLWIGLAVAAVVGPISVLCLQRALAHGAWASLSAGLGAAVADGVYGSIAAFGLTGLSDYLIAYADPVRLLGGAFLLVLAWRIVRADPAQAEAAKSVPLEGARAFATTFLLTMANPATVLSFAAIFASVGLLDPETSYRDAAAMVLGVFAGSALWWAVLAHGGARLGRGLGPAALRWVNRLAGAVIGAFGAAAVLTGAMAYA